MTAVDTINAIIASGAYNDILGIVKGFRNGAVYGGIGAEDANPAKEPKLDFRTPWYRLLDFIAGYDAVVSKEQVRKRL